ncbi:MAG: oligosaccharide flippase family protein [Desulfamplus sp.]|nr:oligosaccharide flippase family protein [Desulfamplus sp.]
MLKTYYKSLLKRRFFALISDTLILSTLNYADQIIAVFMMIMFTKFCDMLLLGQYLTLAAFWTWGTVFVDFGFTPLIIKASAEQKDIDLFIQQVLACKLILLLLLFFVIYLLNSLIWKTSSAVVFCTATIVAVRGCSSTISAFMAGKGKVLNVAACQVSARVVLAALLWIPLVLEERLFYAILTHLLVESLLLTALCRIMSDSRTLLQKSIIYLKPYNCLIYLKPDNYSWIKNRFKQSAEIGLTASSTALLLRQPLVWLERTAPEMAALYGVALRVIELLFIPFSSLIMILFPEMVVRQDKFKLNLPLNFRQYFYSQLFFLIFIILIFIFPNFHIFKFISLPLTSLDASIPYIGLCSLFYLLFQISALILFFKNQLQIIIVAAIVGNAAQGLIFFFIIISEKRHMINHQFSIILTMFSFALSVLVILFAIKRIK